MNIDDTIISGFGSKCDGGQSFTVDFTLARPMKRKGSTCDAYECTIQRRHVFVKRLKAEFRDNPLYKAAFDKEYDLGVSLSHPSLPRYVGFGGDYIVMDFIEGDTLADLIARDDRRLHSRKFIRRTLLELLDVVEYLHRRNIVHCDIKADNVIVSPYNDRPVTLIDLDKAYTSWLGTTHGNTQKYGCEGCADGAIDFRGLGKTAEALGMKRIGKVCAKECVSIDELKNLLRPRNSVKIWTGPVMTALVITALAWAFWPGEDETGRPLSEEAVKTDTVCATLQTPQTIALPQRASIPATPIDNEWLASLIATKTTGLEQDQRAVEALMDCDTIPYGTVADSVYEYNYKAGLAKAGIISDAVIYYYNLPELDVHKAVRAHPAFLSLEKRLQQFDEKYFMFLRKRKITR